MLARAGGSAEYTDAGYVEIVERYGGSTNVSIHFEADKRPGRPPVVELKLIWKPPANTELMS